LASGMIKPNRTEVRTNRDRHALSAGDFSRWSSMAEQPEFVVTCVHGTFGRRAKWANPESEFARSIRALLPGVVSIYSHSWSGANTQKARRQASTKLKGELVERFELYPTAAHFLIGHSHGGNVAIYAIDDVAVDSRLNGVICINTPFIAVTARHTQNMILMLIASFSLFLMCTFSLLTVAILLDAIGSLWGSRVMTVEPILWWPVGVPLVTVVPITIVGLWLSWRLFRLRTRIDLFFQRQRDQLIAATRLPTIKRTSIFCLWSCSDEVYGAFSLLEGVANLPYILMHSFFSILVFLASAGYSFTAWYFPTPPDLQSGEATKCLSGNILNPLNRL
jgi:hypothetical protein